MSRGRTVQRAMTDCSIRVKSVVDMPIMTTRLADDEWLQQRRRLRHVGEGVSLRGALLDQLTAPVDVGAGLEDHHDRGQPGQRSDRITSTPSTPLSRSCSRGTVINCSTSSAERPGHGLDLRVRWAELWRHLQRCVAELHKAHGEHTYCRRQDQEAELHNPS